MGIRETLNRHRGLGTGVAAVVAVASLVIMFREMGGDAKDRFARSFYTIDEQVLGYCPSPIGGRACRALMADVVPPMEVYCAGLRA